MAAFDIGNVLARRPPPPPAQRAAGPATPVRIHQLPDGRIVATGQYGGAKVLVEIPASVSRYVTVGDAYTVAGGPEALVGGIFDNIMKVVSKIQHSKIVQVAASTALAAYPGIPPGVTMKAMELSGDLLDKARAGTPAARARLRRIARAAEDGQPTAVAAVAVIRHRNRADRRTRAAMDLLWRAQNGNPRSQEAVQKIEAAAAQGHPAARVAATAMQFVLDASARQPAPPAVAAQRQPAPPAVAAQRQPPPPVLRRAPAPPALRALPSRQPPPPAVAAQGGVLTLRNARVLTQRVRPDGKKELVVQVGGVGIDWIKTQLGLHRPMRSEAASTGLRDLYMLGAAGR